MRPRLYAADPLGPIGWPEDFPLAGCARVSIPEQADFLLFPWYWQDFAGTINPSQLDPSQPELARALQLRLEHLERCSERLAKPLLLFLYHDTNEPLPHRYGLVWRTSLLATSRGPQQAALPAFHDDVIEQATQLGLVGPTPLPWQPAPSVGFCGQAMPIQLPWRNRLRQGIITSLGLTPSGPQGYWLRRDAMRRCLKVREALRCSFLITHPNDPLPVPEQKRRFLGNLFSSAYILCGSGYGNYSYRFYESLSAGRIPVLIDSDVVLPFEERIPWQELIVRVPADQLQTTPERILAFHRRFTPQSFAAHQQRLRQLWEQVCTPLGFQQTLQTWLSEQIAPR